MSSFRTSPSPVPEDLGPILTQYTIQGFRVIALAHRTLETKLSWHAAQRTPRDQVSLRVIFPREMVFAELKVFFLHLCICLFMYFCLYSYLYVY